MSGIDPTDGCPLCGTISSDHDPMCARGGRVQYCQDGFDISFGMYADEDCDEVRVWSGGLVLVAVAEEPDGRWLVKTSDVAPAAGLRFSDREAVMRYVAATIETGGPPTSEVCRDLWA